MQNANAKVCQQQMNCPDTIYPLPGCTSGEVRCYGSASAYKAFYYCTACATNYKLREFSDSATGCTFTNQDCEAQCTGCSNCTSDTSWSSAGTGYEKKVTRTCNCNTCNTSTSYRCAAGYYGSSSNGTSGCTRCPSNGNSAAGSTSATGCYIISGSDGTGSFKYTQNCYYK